MPPEVMGRLGGLMNRRDCYQSQHLRLFQGSRLGVLTSQRESTSASLIERESDGALS